LLINIPEFVPSLYVRAPFVTFISVFPKDVLPVSLEKYEPLFIPFKSSPYPGALNTYTPVFPKKLLKPVELLFILYITIPLPGI